MFFITCPTALFCVSKKTKQYTDEQKKSPKKPSPIHPSINKSGTGRLLLDEIILPAPEIDLRLDYIHQTEGSLAPPREAQTTRSGDDSYLTANIHPPSQAYSRTRAFTAVEKKDDDKNQRIRLINECLKRCIRSLQSLFLGATAKGARMDIFP